MAARLAEEWFAICGGCEVTILDIGEPLLDVLKQVEIVHMPVLMDHKLFGQTGEGTEMEIPAADVGLISGGIRSEEHKKLAQEMRKKCKILISLGSCACFGGVPALANQFSTAELLEKVYRDSVTTEKNGLPFEEIPALTDRVYAVHEVVKVDAYLPGCPTTPEMVTAALVALIEGKPLPVLPSKSVCDECPTKREKKAVSTREAPPGCSGIYAGSATERNALLDGAGHSVPGSGDACRLRWQRRQSAVHSRVHAM